MRAFHDIRTQMRETCADLTSISQKAACGPVRRTKDEHLPELGSAETHIQPWMAAAFGSLVHSGQSEEPFVLLSCLMNGEPAALIAYARDNGRRTFFTPLFLAVQPWMKFAADPRDEPDDAAA
jgi:hypothetical protein